MTWEQEDQDFKKLVEDARRTDLLAVVGPTRLRRVGQTLKRGPEYQGSCPRCGGTDRFKVFPQIGKWFCRHCTGDTNFQDVIALQAFITTGDYQPRGEAFRRAVEALTGGSLPRQNAHREVTQSIPATPEDEPPDLAWQSRGWELVERAEKCLWGEAGQEGLNYLHVERLLKNWTIKHWRFGYIPDDFYMPFSAWGLPAARNPRRRGIWLPRGILIPTFTEDGRLWSLHVRRFDRRHGWEVQSQKLPFVTGSRKALWGTQNLDRRVIFLCGGELDGALAQQEGADVGGACSFTTGEGSLISPLWINYLLADLIITAYDADAAGQNGAWRQIFGATARAVICPPPSLRAGDKDLTDYAKAGGDLGQWMWACRREHLRDDIAVLAQRLETLAPVRQSRMNFYLDLEGDHTALVRLHNRGKVEG